MCAEAGKTSAELTNYYIKEFYLSLMQNEGAYKIKGPWAKCFAGAVNHTNPTFNWDTPPDVTQ
jgi:hypothetical protein